MVDYKKYVCLEHNKIMSFEEALVEYNGDNHEIIPFLVSSHFDVPTSLFLKGSDGYYRLFVKDGSLAVEKVELTED
jgi:hypothetical protein